MKKNKDLINKNDADDKNKIPFEIKILSGLSNKEYQNIKTDSDNEDVFIKSDIENEFDMYYNYNVNNHRVEGKHSLKWDSILHGKKNTPEEAENIEEQLYSSVDSYIDTSSDKGIERGTDFEFESKNFMEYMSRKTLSQDVYKILDKQTKIDFYSNRRKPNKQTFNEYYNLLLTELSDKYPNYEIFVELSYYFTDNIFNMYKLLDKVYAAKIINELRERGYLKGLKNINFP